MRPRVVAAEISHETNVFSSVRTDLAAFNASGLRTQAAIIRAAAGTNSCFGGFIDGCRQQGLDLFPILSVRATPSGIVTADAIDALVGILIDGIIEAGRIDGVLMALHGAMVTEHDDDGDAHILESVRQTVGATTPIVATLDLHANISPRMVAAADVLIGYDAYPHVDMAERAREACAVLARLIEDGAPLLTTSLRKPPMLPTSQQMATDRDPMRTLMARAHEMEALPNVLNVTVAGGFPPADVTDAGLGVLVTTHDDQSLADRLSGELARLAWSLRDGFLGGVSSFEEAAQAIDEARKLEGPLVIVDIADNPWTGGPGDSAELLRFLLTKDVDDAALASIKDLTAVQNCIVAGVGAEVDLSLGGKTDQLHGEPLEVSGYVRMLSDGYYVNEGPMMAGIDVDLGPTAVVVCGPRASEAGITVLVTSRAETPIDLRVFRAHGIDPTRCRVIGLKGKGHFRAAFEPIASRVVLVEGPGITGADLTRLPFQHIRRPIWPLDPDTTFN